MYEEKSYHCYVIEASGEDLPKVISRERRRRLDVFFVVENIIHSLMRHLASTGEDLFSDFLAAAANLLDWRGNKRNLDLRFINYLDPRRFHPMRR